MSDISDMADASLPSALEQVSVPAETQHPVSEQITATKTVDLGDPAELWTYNNLEIPAHTILFFAHSDLCTIDFSIDLSSESALLYYGISEFSDGTGTYQGSKTSESSNHTRFNSTYFNGYYLYVANPTDDLSYADIVVKDSKYWDEEIPEDEIYHPYSKSQNAQ